MLFHSLHPKALLNLYRSRISAVVRWQKFLINEIEQRLGSRSVEVDHVEVLGPNEWLDQVNDFINYWIAVDDVEMTNANRVSLLGVLEVQTQRRQNDFCQVTV